MTTHSEMARACVRHPFSLQVRVLGFAASGPTDAAKHFHEVGGRSLREMYSVQIVLLALVGEKYASTLGK